MLLNRVKYYLYALLGICWLINSSLTSCMDEQVPTLFEKIDNEKSGITFINKNEDNDSFNILDYLYYYNGAGVAAADFNNDGWVDLYFVANSFSNHLYLNKGNFQFENVTQKAGVAGEGSWNTGVTVVDINQDGWQDIYLCKVSNYKKLVGQNQLFVNQGDGTFKEQANLYGLDIQSFSTHASFFDYDKDGDLDMMLLNHSVHSSASFGDSSLKKIYSPVSGAHLYRNENGKFYDVSLSVGLSPSALGYGLGLALGDINNDGWEDVYISNDFHEDDYLLINQRNGTFKDEARNRLGHFSNFSMGNAMADLNNDGYLDIISTDMLPKDRATTYATEAELTSDIYSMKIRYGYYYQYSRNALQISHEGKLFSDVALAMGVAATDWTWGVLAEDFDMDGKKDLFFSNGIRRRMNDLDYIKYLGEAKKNASALYQNQHEFDRDVISKMPDGQVSNEMYQQDTPFHFVNVTHDWGLGGESLSSGSLAVDLDNDGDLDLVTNNINQLPSIYKNNSNKEKKNKFSLKIKVHGEQPNRDGIGLRVILKTGHQLQTYTNYPHTGFMSSRQGNIHIGLGKKNMVDSILLIWPSQKIEIIRNISSDNFSSENVIEVFEKDASASVRNISLTIKDFIGQKPRGSFFEKASEINTLSWKHEENTFYDDNYFPLIPRFYSQSGPKFSVADINDDGLDDIYLGGASRQEKTIAYQMDNGSFNLRKPFDEFANALEVVSVKVGDMNGDHKKDMVIASSDNNPLQLFASGLFIQYQTPKGFQTRVIMDSCFAQTLEIYDFNNDGRMDIFFVGRTNPFVFGEGSRIYIFEQDANHTFIDKTKEYIEEDRMGGIVTDVKIVDMNQDGMMDILLAGEWMKLKLFYQQKNVTFKPTEIGEKGWWQSLTVTDINGDGHFDIIAGNWGHNTKLKASKQHPLRLYFGDVDKSGKEDLIISFFDHGEYYPFALKAHMEESLPFLKKKYLSYREAAQKTVNDIFEHNISEENKWETESFLSTLFIQQKNPKIFSSMPLPEETQWAPIFSSIAIQTKAQNHVLLGTNFFGVSVQQGRYDAGLAGVLSWNNFNQKLIFSPEHSLLQPTRNPIMDVKMLTFKNRNCLLVGSNNGILKIMDVDTFK